MQPFEQHFHEQIARIDRLLRIISADDPQSHCGSLEYYDIVGFACQCMWHLKDWILNDHHFGASDKTKIKIDIHAEKCLLICSDLANGTKHLSLNAPKTKFAFSTRTGTLVDSGAGVFQVFYYVVCSDLSDPYNGMEVRELLLQCRAAWDRIINEHHLSSVDNFLMALSNAAESPC